MDEFDASSTLEVQTEIAASQLTRYGGSVFDEDVLALLWAVAEINDDLWHSRSTRCVQEQIDKAREALDAFARKADGF